MTSACRPFTARRRLAALLCAALPYAAAFLAPGPAGAETCGTCARTSLGLAPRAYPAGDAPLAAAAGDLDGDGRADLVVANNPLTAGAGKIRVLLGGPLGFVVAGTYNLSPLPRGVALADFDTDGRLDVAVAAGEAGTGVVAIFRNLGGGNLSPAPVVSRSAGNNTSAVVVGDFDGNGTPDVAAAAEGSNEVFVFLGDGNGSLDSGHVISVGAQPRSLVAGSFDADAVLDLAVACAGDDRVRVLRGSGDGTFTTGPILTVGDEPVSLAAADLEADGDLDLVSANHSAGTVSILTSDGTGVFTPAGTSPVVGGTPTGVAVLQVAGTSRLDIVTSNGGNSWVDLLLDDGAGGYLAATHPSVLVNPQAVVPVDADADGRLDLAVPCKSSDAIAVLLARPPGPPPFAAATRYPVGSQPAAAVAINLDGDSDIDLAVANEGASTVSILLNNGSGALTPGGVVSVGSGPRAIVAGDFDRDGIQDLAVSTRVNNEVSVLRGLAGGTFASFVSFAAGSGPDGLAAADVDGDLDLDLLVCNRVLSGAVVFLRNTSTVGAISFVLADSFAVGPDPTSIFAGPLDSDANLDFAVANYTAARLTVLHGNGTGDFNDVTPEILPLVAGDNAPTSVVGADFDGDGDPDLAATVLSGSAVSIFRNDGTSFLQAPSRIPATDLADHAAVADINGDGRLDLAVAARGFEVLRGRGSVTAFEAGEDFVAGTSPVHVAVADFSGDGNPDVAVVNGDSNDVSILLSTRCAARRLEVTQQPAEAACLQGPGPYNLEAVVEARDDGGNLACPAGQQVEAAIVTDTGTAGAALIGTVNSPPRLPLTDGIASFTGTTDSLTIDKAGRRYQLQFSLSTLPAVPPVITHSFTLGAQPVILGPASFCPGFQATYAANPVEGDYDEYRWTLDGGASPFAFTPSVVLGDSLSIGFHTLNLEARVDSCVLPAEARTIWYRAWLRTTLEAVGPTSVCVDCLGGLVKPKDEGGGAVASRQWGYRAAPAGPITPIPGETGETYVVKGTDFPGPDTYYLVVTTVFTCPSTDSFSENLTVLVTAQVATSEVQFLAVTSRGSDTTGENLLQWVSSTGSPDEICINWNKAPDGTSACTFPVAPACPSADGPTWHRMLNPPADTRGWSHAGVTVDTAYCYSVFVYDGTNAPPWSPGRVVKARAFDSDPGPVKWAYSTGATAVVPPVIGKYGVLAMSNDRTVHEVTRGSSGGAWPASWVPQFISGVAHQRSPVIPFAAGVFASADAVLFVGDDRGDVHAIDTKTGQAAWGPVTPLADASITGAPGAILRQYGAIRDLVLVGTRFDPLLSPSGLYGLDLVTGATLASFDGAGALGPISGSPAVDYSSTPQRVYFTSRQRGPGDDTVWAVNVNSGATAFTKAWSVDLGDFDTSPVLRGTRVYVANTTVYSLDSATGSGRPPMNTSDGSVKGFLFPDRRNDDLIFATNTKVRSVTDTAAGFVPKWTWTIPSGSPSVVLYWPGTSYVYVGGSGRLYELNFTDADADTPPTHKEVVLGDGTGQVGAPSLDIEMNPKLLVVGSESGVLYGVEVPFP